MSEVVQFRVEQQLPELKDLLEKKILSADEVRDIVAKRTKFEYKLKRRQAEKSDFILYIEYEKNLEALRKKRVEEMGIKGRHSVSDHSIRQHVYHLYRRALTKFKGDIELWLEYMDYARHSQGKNVLDRLFANALSIHPRMTEFWTRAADWEFQGKGNASAARILLQKGLRVNPESSSLWLAFFKFELDFARNLYERRSVLGIQTDNQGIGQWLLPLVVFRHSLKNLANDIPAMEQFFALVESDPLTKNLANDMVKCILEQFNGNSNSALVKFALKKSSSFAKQESEDDLAAALKIFAESFPSIHSPTLLSDAVDVLSNLMVQYERADILLALSDKVDQIFQVARDDGILNGGLYVRWINLSERHGIDFSDILSEAFSLFPADAAVCYRYAQWLLSEHLNNWNILFKAFSQCPVYRAEFWAEVVGRLEVEDDIENLLKEMIQILPTALIHEIPLSRLFTAVRRSQSSEEFAGFCHDILSMKPISGLIYSNWTASEIEIDFSNSKTIIALFEKALNSMPSSPVLWLNYMQYLLQTGDVLNLGKVYKRALEASEDPEMLTEEYEHMISTQ